MFSPSTCHLVVREAPLKWVCLSLVTYLIAVTLISPKMKITERLKKTATEICNKNNKAKFHYFPFYPWHGINDTITILQHVARKKKEKEKSLNDLNSLVAITFLSLDSRSNLRR